MSNCACRVPVVCRILSGCIFEAFAGNAPSLSFVYKFDLLHRDGRDLRPLPLTPGRPCLRMVAIFKDGAALLEQADRLSLEGIVSKRKASPYRSGSVTGLA